jgi:hypothetical protein
MPGVIIWKRGAYIVPAAPASKIIWLMHTAHYSYLDAWNVFHSTVRFWNLYGWSFFRIVCASCRIARLFPGHVCLPPRSIAIGAGHRNNSHLNACTYIHAPSRLIIWTAICDRNRSTIRTHTHVCTWSRVAGYVDALPADACACWGLTLFVIFWTLNMTI